MNATTLRGAVPLLALLAAAAAQAGAAPGFAADVAPLLKYRCAPCHLTGDEAGGMALHPGAAWKTLVNTPSIESPLLRVKPGAPDESYLVRKLEGTHLEAGGQGMRMPMEGGPLSDADIRMIRDWVAAGALQN